MIQGSAALDYILVESSSVPENSCYYVSGSCVGSSTSVVTLGLKKFLADNYGKRIIAGQTVTPGSNAEIDASPARPGELPQCAPAT